MGKICRDRHAPQRRPGEERHRDRRKDERSPAGRHREQSASHKAEQRSNQHRDLLCTIGASVVPVLEAIMDESAVGSGHCVDANIGHQAEQCRQQERVPSTERNGSQTSGRHEASARDEGAPTVPITMAPVAPDSDRERHCEARNGVNDHDRANQARRVLDVGEYDRKVGRRHGPHNPSADGRGRKHQ